MIRAALTVSMSDQDQRQCTFIVNQTRLGFLSDSPQKTHIQTNHRPVQYMAAICAGETKTDETIKLHQQNMKRWSAVFSGLVAQGVLALNDLCQKFKVIPGLFLAYDQDWLQAWLPNRHCLYRLRDEQLVRIKPVVLEQALFGSKFLEEHSFYSLQLAESDYILVLPRELITFFTAQEVVELLCGLRQLSAKVGELFRQAALRGYHEDETWVAFEVVLKEDDQHPPAEPGDRDYKSTREIKSSRQSGIATLWTESDVEGIDPPEIAKTREQTGLRQRFNYLTRTQKLAVALGALLVVAALIWLLQPGEDKRKPVAPVEETTVLDPALTASEPAPTAGSRTTPAVEKTPDPEKVLTVAVNRLNFRDEPGVEGKLIRTLTKGEQVTQLEAAADSWVKVRLQDGQVGFVFAEYVSGLE